MFAEYWEAYINRPLWGQMAGLALAFAIGYTGATIKEKWPRLRDWAERKKDGRKKDG